LRVNLSLRRAALALLARKSLRSVRGVGVAPHAPCARACAGGGGERRSWQKQEQEQEAEGLLHVTLFRMNAAFEVLG
jgi:hypothetical protein